VGAQKRKMAIFHLKIDNFLEEVCYKVSLCENCQRQSCKAFIGLTIDVGGGSIHENFRQNNLQKW